MSFVEILRDKGIENAQDYEFLDTNKNLGENIHLLVYGGSKAYGTNLPTSDTDIRGIATNTTENILLGKDFEAYTNEATDTVIYSANKIFQLLSNCNPNTIEILFVRDEDILYMDGIGKMIRDNRDIFLSNKCIETFGGYANGPDYDAIRELLLDINKKVVLDAYTNNLKIHLTDAIYPKDVESMSNLIESTKHHFTMRTKLIDYEAIEATKH